MIDVSRYIGLPYEVEGRGPSAYDCWGIIRLAYAEMLGIDLPAHTGYGETMTPRTACMIEDGRPGWRSVDQPQPMDVVLFNINGIPNHIGLVIAPSMMLHTTSRLNACIENFRRPVWVRRIEGFYRHADVDCPSSPAAQ